MFRNRSAYIKYMERYDPLLITTERYGILPEF